MNPETLSRIAKKWRWLLADDSDAIDAAADAWEAEQGLWGDCEMDLQASEDKVREVQETALYAAEVRSLRTRLEAAELEAAKWKETAILALPPGRALAGEK